MSTNGELESRHLRTGTVYERRDGGTPSTVLGLYTSEDGVRMVLARHRGVRTTYRVTAEVFCADHLPPTVTITRVK